MLVLASRRLALVCQYCNDATLPSIISRHSVAAVRPSAKCCRSLHVHVSDTASTSEDRICSIPVVLYCSRLTSGTCCLSTKRLQAQS